MHTEHLTQLVIQNDVHHGYVIRAHMRFTLPLQRIVQCLQCVHYVIHVQLHGIRSIAFKLLKHLGVLSLARLLLDESKDLFEHVLRVRSESGKEPIKHFVDFLPGVRWI